MKVSSVSPLLPKYMNQLMKLYASAWWATSREISDVQRMVDSTPVTIGLIDDDTEELAAFARVLTDDVYVALILDVIVHPSYRGTGLGRTLMDAVLAHPRVSSVRSVELTCQPDLVAFYRRWGFTDNVGSLLMRLRKV
jgi:predicted GNAT family N-acyltransferase